MAKIINLQTERSRREEPLLVAFVEAVVRAEKIMGAAAHLRESRPSFYKTHRHALDGLEQAKGTLVEAYLAVVRDSAGDFETEPKRVRQMYKKTLKALDEEYTGHVPHI